MKKGMFSPVIIFWVVRIIALTIVLLLVPLFISAYTNIQVNVAKTEAVILTNKIMSSPALHATTQYGTDSSIFDAKKFTDAEPLLIGENDFGLTQRVISARITLFNRAEQPVRQTYFNKPLFNDLEKQVLSNSIFKAAVGVTVTKLPVVYVEDKSIQNGNIMIEVFRQV